MIRVLHILTDSNVGGAGRYLINYLQYRDRDRFQVSVILPRGSALAEPVRALGVPVTEVDGIAERSLSLRATGSLKRAIRAEKPDLVHTHGSFSGRIAAKQCGVPVIYTRHSAFPAPGWMKRGAGRWLYGALDRHYADHVIAVSPATVENLLERGVDRDRITMMMNGAPALTPLSPEEKRDLRARLGIPEGVFTAGILARLEPYKGHMLLLEAAETLRTEGRDFRFLIAGAGSQAETVKAEIQRRKLEDRVLFLGFLPEVAPVLDLLDVQLNCSYGTEASSVALIEGMSLGKPTVASDYGGNPWQVEDGVTGLLFESRNSADLAEKLRRLMDSPALREHLGRQARAAYKRKYTGEIFAGNIEAVYQTVMKEI